MNNGWVKLHRKFLEWEWYDDINTKVLFLHCLLKANHKDKKWRGNLIRRGSFITSLSHLSDETGLSVRQVRTAFNKLESTGEIDKQSTSLNTCVTITNYDDYQENDKVATSERQTNDKRATTTKNEKNVKNEKNISPLVSDYPNIKSMQEPLTKEQGEQLISEYGESAVKDILMSMENWKPLKKKNKSANLTAHNWLKKRNANSNGNNSFNPEHAKKMKGAFK